jgi:hypothetical protein
MTAPTKLVQSTFCPFREDCAAPGVIHLHPEPRFIASPTQYQEHQRQRLYMRQLEARNAVRNIADAIFNKDEK